MYDFLSNERKDVYNISSPNDILYKTDETLIKYMVILTVNINVFLSLSENSNLIEEFNLNNDTYLNIANFSKKSYEIRDIVHNEIINRQQEQHNQQNIDYDELYKKYSDEYKRNHFGI